MVHEVWGQMDHPRSGQKSSSNFGTECLRIEPPHSTQGLFSPQNTTVILLLWSEIVWHAENRMFSTHFGTPFAIFLGKWAKIGSLTNYCSVSPHYCCNDILYWNVDLSYRKDTNRVSWWWDMTGWWWKVGFTPRAIRHVHPYWQLSSLGVQSTSGYWA